MGKKIQYIGRYVMDGVTLGKGNFARVELATHGVIETKVAIKVMDTKKIKEDYVRQNLHREARIMCQLRHPNIIRLYETLKATTLYCLVLEYAAGGELLAYIKSQKDSRLNDKDARPFIRQLVSALHYLHERNVVHRDLKMENIMLDANKKNIKLIDFGLSNVYKYDEPLRTHCGSPEYAAPELFVVGKTYSFEIDIWSLGIILYAMVIGRLPFRTLYRDEYQRKQLLESIQKGLAPHHEREMHFLPSDLKNLLRRLIEPNPENRIPLSDVMHHPWISKHGKLPFTTFVPPPKDKMMRHQAVSELAIMMGLQRKMVLETVQEHKADELSAMFNMILTEKKKNAGYFVIDHTSRKTGRRDRDGRSHSRERDKVTGKSPDKAGKGKGANPKKVPNKSTLGKADGKSATQTKTKEALRARERGEAAADEAIAGASTSTANQKESVAEPSKPDVEAHPLGESAGVSGDNPQKMKSSIESPKNLHPEKARIQLPSSDVAEETVPEKQGCLAPANKQNPMLLSTASAANTPKKVGAVAAANQVTANGPTRIPQRRGPLNLTLDLSVTNSWSSDWDVLGNPDYEDGDDEDYHQRGRVPVQTVPAPQRPDTLLSSIGAKPPPLNPTTKIPVPSDPKYGTSKSRTQPVRPSTLPCPGAVSNPLPDANKDSGVSSKKATAAAAAVCEIVAPKATPEDLTFTTYSSSSSESIVETMQQEDMLNNTGAGKVSARAGAAVALPSGHRDTPPLPHRESSSKFKGLRNLLFKHFSSEKLDASSSQVSEATQESQSSLTGSQPTVRIVQTTLPPGVSLKDKRIAIKPVLVEPAVPSTSSLASTSQTMVQAKPSQSSLTGTHPTVHFNLQPTIVPPRLPPPPQPPDTCRVQAVAVSNPLVAPMPIPSTSASVKAPVSVLKPASEPKKPEVAVLGAMASPLEPSVTRMLQKKDSLELCVGSKSLLLPKSGSEPLTASGLELHDNAASASASNPGRLASARKECQACGLSPGSPTYRERHKKFCHTGAHALDIFVSPDENPSPTGPLWRPVLMSTLSPQGSPTYNQSSPGPGSPIFKFPKVGAGTPRVPMQTAVASMETYSDEDGEDEDEDLEYCHSRPQYHQRYRHHHHHHRHKGTLPVGHDPQSCLPTTSGHCSPTERSREDCQNKPSREKYKRYSTNGVFTQVPDTSMRLEPVGAASSDSLSGQSTSSRQGDGSTEKLATTGSKARVHPMEQDKCEHQPGEESEASGKVPKSRIPRPASRLGKIQVFGLLQSGDKSTSPSPPSSSVKVEEVPPDSPSLSPTLQQKKTKDQKLLLRQYDSKNKQMTWRQGLSHLLRRTKSNSSSSSSSATMNTNNNVAVLRNKQSNGTTGNSVAVVTKAVSKPPPPPSERESYYREMDARWTAAQPSPHSTPTPSHNQCNSTPMQVRASPVPSNSLPPKTLVYDLALSRLPAASKTYESPHWSAYKAGRLNDQMGQRVTKDVIKTSLDCKDIINWTATSGILS